MLTGRPITEIVTQRYSCRAYEERSIDAEKRRQLQDYLNTLHTGPLGSAARFELVAATEDDRKALRGLGTYGLIRGATGFIVGAVQPGKNNLEDYGYLMEQAILAATDLELGTCWLGGNFTQSSFAKKIRASEQEVVPAVASVGYIPEGQNPDSLLFRRVVGSIHRHPWEMLFFQEEFDRPLTSEAAGTYTQPLEMLRRGPSASNKQPWRVVKSEGRWHFYLQRTSGYGKGTLVFGILRLADLQRVDIGIAMCHFELTTNELGLAGQWEVADPGLAVPDTNTEYIVSWREKT
ncbi:MAG: nitroreductase [Anaerolineae bacterium]|nr:nitroreductase [Anaerolineae bacterium]